MQKRTIFYYLVTLLIILAVYLYTANAFIYYRIGQGNLTMPDRQNIYSLSHEGTESKIKYAALGDSLTSGVGAEKYEESYPYLLTEKISEKNQGVTLTDFSQPGAQTKDLINLYLPEVISNNPDIITVLIGVNDIHNHVSKEQFKNNYQYILERLTKETKAKIYLINIPRIGSDTAILPPLNYYFDKETDDYNQIIKDLSVTYQVKYVDLNAEIKNLFKNDGAHYSVDSFHPSALGYKLWAQIIYDRSDF
ncbi:MAG: SGNH/GDSL hydrolase family protein [Candidatus Falkowbacteria bacterium]